MKWGGDPRRASGAGTPPLRHNDLTVVVDHDRRRVVWSGPGRGAETLGSFFEELGEQRCLGIKTVTIDFGRPQAR